MTWEDIILGIEAEREQAMKTRARAVAEVKTILARAKNEGRANLTEEEDADVTAAMQRRDRANRDLKGIEAKLAKAKAAQAADQEIDAAMDDKAQRILDPATSAAAKPAYDRVARVGAEERTYHPGNSKRGGLFIRDVMKQFLFRDFEADTRLSRHMQEERVERGEYLERAAGTGAFTGLVVPQYLTELYAPAVAKLRPFADICQQLDLPPEGMTVNISRITTASTVATQANENDTVSETDMDDTLLTENVLTAAGSASLTRQAVERGRGIEDVVMSDLQRRYATNLDSELINRATVGLSAIAQAVTYDDTSPSVPEMYPKILQGASQSEEALLAQAMPDVVVMHSRRWYWINAQMVSTWPFMNQPGIPDRQGGVNFAERYGSGFRGVLPNGMAVVVDNNIAVNKGAGTNQDEIYVVPSDECWLWEDPNAPQFIRAEQPQAKKLAIDLVLYGYFAFSLRRYANSHQKIAGTGLVPPTFGS